MPYTIKLQDDPNNTLAVLDEGLTPVSDLELVGKNKFGYGQTIAQNTVKLLEHFAKDTAPSNPVTGQIWFNTDTDTLNVWNGTTWLTIDPGSGPTTILDDQGTSHTVYVVSQNGSPVAMFSSEASFTVANTEAVVGTFPTVHKGITLSNDTDMKFHGTATSAQYADLAELYSCDKEYEAGTLVMIADALPVDVTETRHEKDPDTFGVVSTNPAYLMNSALEGTSCAVALAGRVPCKVVGQVRKGDRLVSSNTAGHARSADIDELDITWKHCFGRALENKTTEEPGIIEVIVGVK